MAIRKSNQSISGSLGNTITYQVGNQTRVRLKPAEVKMPQTPAVIQAKNRFKTVNELAKRIYASTKKVGGERDANTVETAYNALYRLISKTGIRLTEEGAFQYDWEQLQVSEGKEELPTIQLEYTDTELICRWNVADFPVSQFDSELVLIQIDEESLQCVTREAYVKQQELRMPIGVVKTGNERVSYLYLSLVKTSTSKTKRSNSVFLGKVKHH